MGLFNLYGCFVQKQQTLEQTQKRKKWTSFLKDKSKKQKKKDIQKRERQWKIHGACFIVGKGGGERDIIFIVFIILSCQWHHDNSY